MRLLAWNAVPAIETLWRQRYRDSSSSVKAITNGISVESYSRRPFWKTKSLSGIGDPHIIRAIVLLFLLSSPSTVAWRIVLAIVAAVNRVLRARRQPHIFKEILETVPPALAHADAFGPVFMVSGTSRVIAPRSYSDPRFVNLGFAQTVRCIALNAHCAFLIPIKTTAGSRCSLRQAATSHNMLVTATTMAEPRRMLVSRSAVATYNGQATESLSCQIDESRHRVISNRSIR